MPPDIVSIPAGEESLHMLVLLALGSFFTVGVLGAMVFLCVRYRAGSSADRSNRIYQSKTLEAAWILPALLLGLAMFYWGARLYIRRMTPPAGALTTYVLGKQWMWKIYHPEGRTEINELHVPLGKPVSLVLASQDVIHSFFIPEMKVKMDAVPGRYTHLWFQAAKAGRYHFFCTQFCGTDHSVMGGQLIVMEPDEYETWARSAPPESLAQKGEALMANLGCRSCHSPLNASTAPQLERLFGRFEMMTDGQVIAVDENYLRESINFPDKTIVKGYPAVMPSYKDRISEEELFSLVWYIKSLGGSD